MNRAQTKQKIKDLEKKLPEVVENERELTKIEEQLEHLYTILDTFKYRPKLQLGRGQEWASA